MNDVISSWLGQETGHHMSFEVASIRWGLTLLHFLWQGAIIGLLAFVAARLLRNQSASVRYWLNAAALLACPMCVAWTFAVVEVPESWRVSSNQLSLGSFDSDAVPIETFSANDLVDVPYPKLDPPQAITNTDAAPVPLDASAENHTSAPVAIETKTSYASEWMPVVARWIAILYAVGVVCFFVRLAIALWGGHRLRAISTPVSDSALLELIRTQAHRIGLKLVPVVAYCERVAVPTVIGVLRPMILLPATLTTGLTTDELSAILSHELAHIRRYDLWMNLLQRIIESLLFFHPVVWHLSHRLSAEREICCDDLVIRSGHQPMNYAGALLRMAELCTGVSPQNSFSLAVTSGGTSLLEHRVMRLIHKSPSTRLSLDRKAVLLSVLLILAGTMWASANGWLATRMPREQSPSFAEAMAYEGDKSNSDSSEKLGTASITEPKTQETDANYVTVKGRVELEDGTLVDKSGWVYVRSRGNERSSAGTGNLEGGLFSEKLNPGKIFVTAHVEGYAPAWTEEFELTDGTKDNLVMVLTAGVKKTIQVIDESGMPVSGATVWRHPEIHGQVLGPTIDFKTDERGRIVLEHLADTRYQFTISAPGFQTLRTGGVSLSDDDEITHILKRCRPATGTIVNWDGTPAAGAKLFKSCEAVSRGPHLNASYYSTGSGDNEWLGQQIATTTPDGRYEIDQLNDDSQYMITIQGPDGSRMFLSDLEAGQSDRRIGLPERRDLAIKVIGDTSSLPLRHGKPFVVIRQAFMMRMSASGHGSSNSLGADIPLELNDDGGSAVFHGLIIDPASEAKFAEVVVQLGYGEEWKKIVPINPAGITEVEFNLPAKVGADTPAAVNDVQPPGSSDVLICYPHCVVETENIPTRLTECVAAFNLTSQESPTGVLQPPITELETRNAIAKFAAESHVPEAVQTQLNEILKSGELPSNVYFRRFTRFDDGKQTQGVWWVRLVVETGNGPVYSVPVRSTSLFARPYTQMERQQNADGLTLINRVASYYEEPPLIVEPSDLPAASVETLSRKTQDAIKAEDDAALGSLFESTGASETQREFAISELKALSKATVRSVKVSALRLKGELRTWSAWQYFKPNLPIVGFLEIEYEDKDAATRRADAQPLAGDRKVISLELGLVGDELRLVNYVPDGERTPPESLNPGPSITGHLEPLADGTHLVTDIITNPGTLLSAHLANEEIRQRDFRNSSEQEEDSPEADKPNVSNETPPEKTGTPNVPATETKTPGQQKPEETTDTANRYRILSATGEPIANAMVRLIYQKEDFRELIVHSVKHETKTDVDGYFQYPKEFKVPFQVANEDDGSGISATWVTLPADEEQPEQTWLLGSSAGVRFPFFEAVMGMWRDPKKVSSLSAAPADKDAKSIELPNVFRLPKFETTIRVVNADGSPAAGVQVTPSQIAWARVEGGSKNIFVPDIVRDSLSRTTDADGRVTFATIDRIEFAEIEFRSEQHGLQRTFTNMNTIGPELEHDVVLFPAGKVTGTIKASAAEQRKFLRTNKLLLQTQVINLGLPAPKGFRIAMEGIAEVTTDEQGRFEIPAMLAGQMFLLDRLPDNSRHRITLKPRQITKSSESSLIEGQVTSAVKIQGIARKRDSKEGVSGIPISIRHGGRQAGLSRELTVYSRTDTDGRFEAHVFPGRIGYSSLTIPEGYVQAWNWDLDYDAKQEWLYGQRVVVPDDISNFDIPPLEFIRAKEIRGKLVDADGDPVAKTGVYARARANQNGNDFATTDQNGEFVLKGFADGYFPEAVQVGEQFKPRAARIISRDPLILQDSQPAAK
jgi:beta-lactamase regulating signal transducer with metallopeptidase domain